MSAIASDRGPALADDRTSAAVDGRLLTWNRALAALVLVVWLVPIKLYTLPVHLPFSLELYRLLLIVLLCVWAAAIVRGRKTIGAGGLGKPLVVLAGVAALSIAANIHAIVDGGLQTQALKSLSYFLSFLLAYVLVFSTVDGVRGVRTVAKALVAGGVVVAVAALYESRTHDNVFQHLHAWLPLLKPTHAVSAPHVRDGQLRVTASAQHPIALGAALVTALPFALYFATHARTRARAWAAWAGAALLLAGAAATVSRTVVLMLLAMLAVGLLLRRGEIARRWPVLLVIAVAVHFGSPGAVSHLYRAFFPRQGLQSSLDARSGAVGSGRLADLGPAWRAWEQTPFFGHGLGTGVDPATTSGPGPAAGAIVDPKTGAPIVFDDQYLNSVVSIGALGIVGVVWFVWGAGIALVRRGRERLGRTDDLVVACAASVAGYAAGMFTFDAFSFVQCTLLFFVVVALGMKLRALET